MTNLVRSTMRVAAPIIGPSQRARTGTLALGLGCGLAIAAVVANAALAKRAERRHPAQGTLIEIDGVRLHYIEKGSGEPIVLIHGNGVTAQDWALSGVLDRLAASHRVLAFDRPGFGYTQRPRTTIWTARAQADLLLGAMRALGVQRATVVGHSWGTLVAMSMALNHPDAVAKLVLMSGYYRPTPRPDLLLMSGPALPGVGDVLRYTVSPILGRLLAPLMFKQMFSPAPVPAHFKTGFPLEMALRPSQIRASAADTALMAPEAARMALTHAELKMPVLVMAGTGDKIVSFEHQSKHLAKELFGGILHPLRDAGHMIHHTAPCEVASAIENFCIIDPSVGQIGTTIVTAR